MALGTGWHDVIKEERKWGDIDNAHFKLQENFKEERLYVIFKLGVHKSCNSEKHYGIDCSPKKWQFNSKCTLRSLPGTSLALTQSEKYNLVSHQHHCLLHNSFPEEFPIYSCLPVRSSNGMAEDQRMKFHTDRIVRGRMAVLRACMVLSIYPYFTGVAVEKASQLIN